MSNSAWEKYQWSCLEIRTFNILDVDNISVVDTIDDLKGYTFEDQSRRSALWK